MTESSNRLATARGSMDKGSTIQELSRDPVLPRTLEDTFTITMEAIIPMEGVRTTIVAPRIAMGMEEAIARTIPTHQHQPRGISATLPVSSARRLDIMPLNVLKQRMEMAMEALGRSPTLSTRDR